MQPPVYRRFPVPLASGSAAGIARPFPPDDAASASSARDFAALIEQERDLQSATGKSLTAAGGGDGAAIQRLLRHQHFRLGANIAVLEQQSEALPSGERFRAWTKRTRPPSPPGVARPVAPAFLPDLIAQHTRVMADIAGLVRSAPEERRGDFILAEVSRSHEQMVRMLTALLAGVVR